MGIINPAWVISQGDNSPNTVYLDTRKALMMQYNLTRKVQRYQIRFQTIGQPKYSVTWQIIEGEFQDIKLIDPWWGFDSQDNPLKVTPDFEENVYYQASTISFMNQYYGDNIFDCLDWYEKYLTIDPELSTLKRIIFSKISSRIQWLSDFENVFQIQNLIINLLELRKSSDLPQFEEEQFRDSEEKELAQQAYDDILEFLSCQIERRSKDASSNQQSFAYETLIHLILSQSLNENKLIHKYLPILIKYPLYLQSVTKSLSQEMDIMLLQEKDNSLFSHSRFVLFEIHNIVKALICNDKNKINDPIVKSIVQVLKVVFTRLYEKIDSGIIKKQGEIVYIIRHLAQLEGNSNNRLNLEKAIRVQSEEINYSSNQENKEQFAFCHFKLASLRSKLCQFEQKNPAQNYKFQVDGPISHDNVGTQFIEQTFANVENQSQETFLDREGYACSAEDYFHENRQISKQSFELAEKLYDLRVNNPEESPLGKLLSTYYMGRIHQKYHKNEQIALNYFSKTIQIYSQKNYIIQNCRTTQFELIYLKALKRLGYIPSELINKPRLEIDQKSISIESSFKINLEPTVLQSSSKINIKTENLINKGSSQSISEIRIKLVPNNTILEESNNKKGELISLISSKNQKKKQQISQQQNCATNISNKNQQLIQQTEQSGIRKQENQILFLSDLRNNFNYQAVKEIPARELKIKQMIKKGQFGSVYRIQYNGAVYAGKLIQFVRRSFYEQIIHELKGNLLIDHQFVMPTLAVSKWPSQKENNGDNDPIHILLIMDLKNACLEQVIREKQITSTKIAHRIAGQICNGLNALHAFGVAHTNLKLQNVLIDNNLNAFITDWGVSHLFFSEIDRNVDEFTSTFAFTAPEFHQLNDVQSLNDNCFEDFLPEVSVSISQNKKESGRVKNVNSTVEAKQADVWSFGIILLCLFFGFFPNEEQIEEISLYQGVKLKSSNDLEPLSLLVKDMLQINPKERPNITQVQQRLTSIYFNSETQI